MTSQEFVGKLAPIIKSENERRGNPLFTSVVIAQACLETAYGKSEIMMKANAIFGIKAFENWKGKTYSAKTREVYDGNPVTITDKFRAYDSIEESVKDYFNLICKSERYRKALVSESPKECIEAIKNGGYATDPDYVKLVMKIIENYNLTMYDERQIEEPYIIGKNYTLQVNLNVRQGAGTYFDKMLYKDLTPNAKIHAIFGKYGVLKKGTIVTCLEIKHVNSEDIWLRIPSGWIAGKYGGKYYVK